VLLGQVQLRTTERFTGRKWSDLSRAGLQHTETASRAFFTSEHAELLVHHRGRLRFVYLTTILQQAIAWMVEFFRVASSFQGITTQENQQHA